MTVIPQSMSCGSVTGSCTIPTVSTGTPASSAPVVPPTGGGSPAVTAVHSAASSLPFTGADIVELLVVGLVLVAIGAALLFRRRRNRNAIAIAA